MSDQTSTNADAHGQPDAVRSAQAELEAPEAGAIQASAAETKPPHREVPTAPTKVPQWIGRYRLLEVIGKGGMGVVYRAEQREPVRRVVAIKIIKLGMDTAEVIARFDAERQALALMDHPNVAKVLDAGATKGGRPYFVMEYVAGVPLARYCDEQCFGTRERLGLFVNICQAVQHAHQKAVIHRDLKPQNILVTLVDGKPVPKVIDFGIAKATGQRLTTRTLFTKTGDLIGTPEYMSPEQAATSGLDVDTRTDIYSLGVILYELLTSTLPFDSKMLRSGGEQRMIDIIKNQEPPRPSTRVTPHNDAAAATTHTAGIAKSHSANLQTLHRELKGDLDWIVLKAMEKDRGRRYGTVDDLAADIQRYLDGSPVEARPPNTLYRLQKLVRRHKGGVIASSIAVFAVCAGVAAAIFGLIEARHGRSAAVTSQGRAQASEQRAINAEALAKAGESEAKKRLNDSLIRQGSAFELAGRWDDAKRVLAEARQQLVDLKESTLRADLGLCAAYNSSPPALLTLRGHTGSINKAAFTADGQSLVSVDWEGTSRYWDLPLGQLVRETAWNDRHEGADAVIASTGRLAISRHAVDRSNDPAAHADLLICDPRAGALIKQYAIPGGSSVVDGSPSGSLLLLRNSDTTISLFDTNLGKVTLATEPNKTVASRDAILSPDARTFLTSAADGASLNMGWWDVQSGKLIQSLLVDEPVYCSAISPDGKNAVTAGRNHNLCVWDLKNGQLTRTIPTGHLTDPHHLDLTPVGKSVLWGGEDGAIHLCGLGDGKGQRSFSAHNGSVTSISLSAGGHLALSGGADKLVKIWKVPDDNGIRTWRANLGPVNSIAFSPNGRLLASGGGDRTVRLWDVATGCLINTYEGHSGMIFGVAFTPDGRSIVSCSEDKTVRIWQVESGAHSVTFPGHTDGVSCARVLPDGNTVVSCGFDAIRVWNIRDLHEIRHFGSKAFRIDLSSNGQRIISTDFEGATTIWDVRTGEVLRKFAGNNAMANASFSPDATSLMVSSNIVANSDTSRQNVVTFWDAESGTKLRQVQRSSEHVVIDVAWIDASTMLTGDNDGGVTLWDARAGEELGSISLHSAAANGIAYSAATRKVASGSNDGTLAILDPSRVQSYAKWDQEVERARAVLKTDPANAEALATMGEYFAFRGANAWAVELLLRARARGASISPLLLARCYWQLEKHQEAEAEFRRALAAETDEGQRFYLNLCIRAQAKPRASVYSVDTDLRAGKFKQAADGLQEMIDRAPEEHANWVYEAYLLAYLNDSPAYQNHCRKMLKYFGDTTDRTIAERTAKCCLLLPDALRGDSRPNELADRALAGEANHENLGWFRLAKALSEYRLGNYSSAMKWGAAARSDLANNQGAIIVADLLTSMSLFKLGSSDDAAAALHRATEFMDAHLPPFGEVGIFDGFENVMICHILRREAEGLVVGAGSGR